MKKLIAAGILLGLVGAIVATADPVQVLRVQAVQTAVAAPDATTCIDQGKSYLKARNLLAARDQFALAVAADETNQEANFLYGVTRIAAIYENGQGDNTEALDSVREIAELSGFTFTTFGLFQTEATKSDGIAATTPDTGAVIDFLAAKAIPEIEGALLNFSKVTDPAFSSDLGPTGIQQPIFADLADVQVIRAAASLFKCNLELLRVYDLDVSLPSLSSADMSQLMTYRQLLQYKPGLLAPRDASRLDVAKADLIFFIDTFNQGVAAMKARANANSHLFVVDLAMPNGMELSSSETAEFQKGLAEIKASLSGPAVYSFVDPSSPAAMIDLSKFFNSAAPINLRTSVVDCSGGVIIPDVTVGGMFPLGLGEIRSSLLSAQPDALGVACSSYGAPSVNLSSDWASFQPEQIYPFTIANRGTANLTTSISVQGANVGDFQLTPDTCTTLTPTLAPGASCTVKAKFHPVASGYRAAFLDISSNDPNDSHLFAALNGYTMYPQATVLADKAMSIVADPFNASTFYIAARGAVLKSTDGGANWSAAAAGLPTTQVNGLAIPTAGVIFAGTDLGLYKSVGGAAWTAVPNMGISINALATMSGRLLAAGYDKVYSSLDGGGTWNSSTLLNPSKIVTLAVDAAHAGVVFAGTWQGLYRSSDSGVTWNAVTGTPRDASFNKLAITSILITPSDMFAGTWQGLYRSSDGGVTWLQVDLGTGYQASVAAITGSPSGNLYLSAGYDVLRSSDNGSTWSMMLNRGVFSNINSMAVPDASWLLVGADSGIYRLAIPSPTSFTLTATPFGNGSFQAKSRELSLSAPVSQGSSYTWTLPQGTTLELYPEAAPGSVFAGWSGCDKIEDSVCRMTMTGSRAVSAQFALDDRTLSLTAYPAGGSYTGSVSVALLSNKSVPIRYTLDGSDPTDSSPLYDGPVTLQTSAVPIVLKFRGYDAGGPGQISTETYAVTPPARFSFAGVTHLTLGNGTVKDVLDAGLATPAANINGLTMQVTGPENFSYTFSNSDLQPWFSGTLVLYKEFTSLVPGVYTFTMRDASGHTVVRSDTHAAVPAISPVDPSTIRFVRKSDGSYRISWGPAGGPHPYYYRVRINRASDHVPVYTSARKMELFEDVNAGIMTNGTAYEVRVEASDSDSTDSMFSRANSAYKPFTPSAADYNASRSFFSFANVFSQVGADGTQKVALMFSIANANIGNATQPLPTLAEVDGPDGFHAQFDLAADLLPGSTNYFKTLTPPLPPGPYTFHVVANGVDNYASATLTSPTILPLTDQSTWQVQDPGTGGFRFSWAGADYSGALYYRVTIRDTTTNYTYSSPRQNQAFADLPKSSLPPWVTSTSTAKVWRVEVYDGSSSNTLRNRRDGSYVPLALPGYNPSIPVIGNFGIRNQTRFDGTDSTHAWLGVIGQAPMASLTVTGPDGYSRDLLALGQRQDFLGGFYSLTEANGPAAGLYTFTATDGNGNQSIRYDYQPAIHALPVVDARTIHVETDPNGDTRLSWAPVAADIPLWYYVQLNGANNLNSDGKIDAVYQSSPSTAASAVIPLATMNQLPRPLMLRVRALDGSGNTVQNNSSQSVMVALNMPGYDYSVLADGDGDGFASDVDLNDNDRAVYPFAPPPPANAILTVTPSTLEFGSVPVGSTSAPLSFTFTNNGPDSVTVYSAEMSGSFRYLDNSGNCPDLPHTFAPGEGCTSGSLVFSPTATGPQNGSQIIATNSASSSVLTVTMTGTGVQAQYSLTTKIVGNGSINNLNQSTQFVCTDPSCTSSFPAGSSFNLSATPSGSYLFSGWAGGGCSGQGNCVISALGADTTVTATFAPIPLVQILGRTDSFQTLQEAFNMTAANDVVKARNILFTEGVVFNYPFGIRLKGGLAADFTATSGSTDLKGSLTVKSGSLTIDNLVIY